MTPGQQGAVRELERLHGVAPEAFDLVESPREVEGGLRVRIGLRVGPLEKREGGLELREREEFILIIPPDFPFGCPWIKVDHDRFAGFPHVVWSTTLCLYQSELEWNPADGLYGFFDRLRLWLRKAALNDMDPVDGPLEPPHHVTDFSQVPFVVRANAPVQAGRRWCGVAELETYPNRVELTGWHDLAGPWPERRRLALAIVLPRALPMEFPRKGREFFEELVKQGFDREEILQTLAGASLLSPEGQPIHLVLGLPMRRSLDGAPRLHFAVWTTDERFVKHLRAALPTEIDTDAIRSLRRGLAEVLLAVFDDTQILWCRVLEDRSEVLVRRDAASPAAWFGGKKILILGCGALGSWAAEIIARANAARVDLLDGSLVKPGLLARQNFRLDDIASGKAAALADRLRAIAHGIGVEHFRADAHRFLTASVDRLGTYDLLVDCTASSIFHMMLERDWAILGPRAPALISMVIDAKAQRGLAVLVGSPSKGGSWDAYMRLRYTLSRDASGGADMVNAFYGTQSTDELIQPEPGCSDPTFSGSTADVAGLVSTALNVSARQIRNNRVPVGIAFSSHSAEGRAGACNVYDLSAFDDIVVGGYRVRFDHVVYDRVRALVRENNHLRSPDHETGGLLWGLWDEAIGVIWVFDASGPPPDSAHDPGHFICGVDGTRAEHAQRLERSRGIEGFIGFWHTHPSSPPEQSLLDIRGMAELVTHLVHNSRHALMLIFGRETRPSTRVYLYESASLAPGTEMILVGTTQVALAMPVV